MSDDTSPIRASSKGLSRDAAQSGKTGLRGDARSLNPSDSPCVAVCSTLYDDICRGCGRTAMEVANWVFFDDTEKRAIWDRITAQGYPRRQS